VCLNLALVINGNYSIMNHMRVIDNCLNLALVFNGSYIIMNAIRVIDNGIYVADALMIEVAK
jgi:hypothetical protein